MLKIIILAFSMVRVINEYFSIKILLFSLSFRKQAMHANQRLSEIEKEVYITEPDLFDTKYLYFKFFLSFETGRCIVLGCNTVVTVKKPQCFLILRQKNKLLA